MRQASWALLALLIVGCAATAKRGEPFSNDPDRSDPAVARGEVQFSRHCHQCHPFGAGGLGPKLNDKPIPGGVIKLQVRAGLGMMPGFGPDQIDAAELDDLVAYMLALRAQKPDPERVAPPD